MKNFEHPDKFVNRHIGPDTDEINEMLNFIGVNSLDELIDETVPAHIRLNNKLNIDPAVTEFNYIKNLKKIAAKNKIYKSYIGMGYYPTITPPVIQRNVLENPGWYTQYTPYQAEISQGRLEALLNFQTAIIDLTGMPIANASLLDEGTAAAEAMSLFYALRKNKDANVMFVSENCFPQTIDVLKTRAVPFGIELKIGGYKTLELTDDIFAMLVQYPSGKGEVIDYSDIFSRAAEKNIYKVVAADLLSLTLLKPPGEFGADVVVGSSQRFGVPMGYGGPHAAFFSAKEDFKRHIPGRIIGKSIDSNGNDALRMALQTREQHIRREKATSNICTAQVLLAVMAGMYAVYHGPKGIKKIAERINKLTMLLNEGLKKLGYIQSNEVFFDTLNVKLQANEINKIREIAESKEINFRYLPDNSVGISIAETDEFNEIADILSIFAEAKNKKIGSDSIEEIGNSIEEIGNSIEEIGNSIEEIGNSIEINFPQNLIRESSYLKHEVFNSHHSETEMLRYLKMLENKDLSLAHSMIPLGSCTMKLNATTEMLGITWPEFSNIHPFAPVEQALGYKQIFEELEKDLSEITGFPSVSLQPNSGAQGEFTGLLVIREYHINRGEGHRNVVLIPSSAHGTNPASAVMAGMKVVVTACDENGNIDLDDLKKKAELNKDNLSALMVTYPSTHGVFEEKIKEICKVVHDNGGLVYMDGANMNAQVGLTSPANIGADVCHLNLHKTFCIPHGGGGPGVGPIGVAEHLVPFLPNHSVVDLKNKNGIHSVSSAPWGSADILVISHSYIKMMGADGLTQATKIAILNANYIKAKLEDKLKVLYKGSNGRVAHELIFDMRPFKNVDIEVEDLAKRLMDYGYHAPTVSFPVAGTLMVEPTESESKGELDRFCDVLNSILNEIKEIEDGTADKKDNVLKNAPHTIVSIVAGEWKHSYSREKAAFPAEWTKFNKFWPSVGRVNNAYGDRNLICSCNTVSDYAEGPVS